MWAHRTTRGIGTLCPCCKVPGTPEPLGFGLIRRYAWLCPVCGARGQATRSKIPGHIIWHGVDMAKAPIARKLGTVPFPMGYKELMGAIMRSYEELYALERVARRKDTMEAWEDVLAKIMEVRGLVARKYTIALDLCGKGS